MTSIYYIHVIEYSMPVLPPAGHIAPEWVKSINEDCDITDSVTTVDGVYMCGVYYTISDKIIGYDDSNQPIYLPSCFPYGDHSFIIKYNHSGTIVWCNKIAMSVRGSRYSIAASSSSIYVYGVYFGDVNVSSNVVIGTNINNIQVTLPISNSNTHSYLIKYTINGKIEWALHIPRYNIVDKYGIAASETNVYIIGDYSSPNNIAIENKELPAVEYGVYVLNYTAGGHIAWVKSLDFTNASGLVNNEQTYSVAVTGNALYISGTYSTYGVTSPPNIIIGRINGQDITLPQTSARWGYIMQYQLDGALVAYNTIKANRNVDLCMVAASGNNVYLCGRYDQENTSLVIGVNSSNTQVVLPNYNMSTHIGYIISFEPNTLNPVWARTIPTQHLKIYDLICTADSLYICGVYFNSTNTLLGNTAGGIDVNLPVCSNYYPGFLIKYDAGSNPVWTKVLELETSTMHNYSLTVYENVIYFSGSYVSSTTPVLIGNSITITDTNISTSLPIFYLIKYSPLELTVTITPGTQTATVNWMKNPKAAASATNKLYYYPTSQLSSLQDISLTSQTQALTGLQPSTSYTLYTSTTVDGLELLSPVYVFVTLANPICFLADAPVLTPTGYRPIHMLQVGDLVRTAAGRTVAVKRVFSKQYQPSASANPYVIPKGLFGAKQTLPISPNHEVMVTGKGMVKAKDLGLPRMKMTEPFMYYNLELEDWVQDNLIVAGVVCESLAPAERITMTKAEFMRFVKARYRPEAAGRLRSVCFEESSGDVSLPKLL